MCLRGGVYVQGDRKMADFAFCGSGTYAGDHRIPADPRLEHATWTGRTDDERHVRMNAALRPCDPSRF